VSIHTEAQLEAMFQAASDLDTLIQSYTRTRHDVDSEFPAYWDIDEIDEGGATLTTQEYQCSCCGPETRTEYISIADLLDHDMQRAHVAREARERKAQEEREQRAADQKKAEERRERSQLATLQRKYGSTS